MQLRNRYICSDSESSDSDSEAWWSGYEEGLRCNGGVIPVLITQKTLHSHWSLSLIPVFGVCLSLFFAFKLFFTPYEFNTFQ